MESTGVPGCVQVSQDTYDQLGHMRQMFEPRGEIAVKGKGVMKTYLMAGAAAAC